MRNDDVVAEETHKAAKVFCNKSCEVASLSGFFLLPLDQHPSSKMVCFKTVDSNEKKKLQNKEAPNRPTDAIHLFSITSVTHQSQLSCGATTGLRPGAVSALWKGHTERQSTCLALCLQPCTRNGHLDFASGDETNLVVKMQPLELLFWNVDGSKWTGSSVLILWIDFFENVYNKRL